MVFRPLAGCGLFPSGRCLRHGLSGVSVPLRGVGCFRGKEDERFLWPEFPSPCGVWVVSTSAGSTASRSCFRPLAGCGLFPIVSLLRCLIKRFRPLAGCGLFPPPSRKAVQPGSFRPLAGCGLFHQYLENIAKLIVFPSPCGVWVVSIFNHYPRT